MIQHLLPLIFLLTFSSSHTDVEIITTLVDKDMDYLSDFYKDRHKHAEISLEEKETSKALADAMREVGYTVTEGVGGYGIVAMMKNGNGPQECMVPTSSPFHFVVS